MNKRITPKERNLLKGAIRRVFSRSELRRRIIEASVVQHSDPKRKRVKTWCICAICGKPEAKSNMQVDHLDPIIPIHLTLEEMSWDTVIDRTWCQENNLQAVDKNCHKLKTKEEQKTRRRRKNEQRNKAD